MFLTAMLCSFVMLPPLVVALALPTNPVARQLVSSVKDDTLTAVCSETKCRQGSATLDPATGLCVCPQWPGQDPVKPCGFLLCPNTTEVYFSSATNQCLCKVKHVTPMLIHQATNKIAQQNATVYSVQPYFLDGVISFHVQLSGAPGGFNLNASTVIPAASIGTDPEPNLVLVPMNMKSRVPKSAEETARIIAVTFNTDDTITYHVQLDKGTVLKLEGDKYVHDIDLIDPAAPPTLSILTSTALSHLKRDVPSQYEEANPPLRAGPRLIATRGIESVTSNTAIFDEETCHRVTCLKNGGKKAMFNPLLKSCYCQQLVPPKDSLSHKTKRFKSDNSERQIRREADDSLVPSGFLLLKPSVETCPRLIVCKGESKPYFDDRLKQCLCVIYREGVKEPVITSDSKILPRTEMLASLEERYRQENLEDEDEQDEDEQDEDDQDEDNQDEDCQDEDSQEDDDQDQDDWEDQEEEDGWKDQDGEDGLETQQESPDTFKLATFCQGEFARAHCIGGSAGRWNHDFKSCVCVYF